jgi:hypothetical protein
MALGRLPVHGVAVLVLFAGCGSSASTLQQTRVWDAYNACRASGRVDTNIQIDRVEPSGRWWWRTSDGSHGRQELEACMQQEVARWKSSSPSRSAVLPPADPTTPPVWRPGEEWAFRSETPAGSITFVWSVDREEVLDGVPHYVIKSGAREIFFRRSDFALSRETVDGAIVLNNMPARFYYVWPMRVGQSWDQTILEERPRDRQTNERVDTVTVETEETVTVPAGTFKTMKIICRNKKTGAIRYESWYSLELKQMVKTRENLGAGLRVRELIAFKLR